MQTTQVAIIGAGPVGLISAIALDQLGISSVLIEQRLSRTDAPKAHAVNPRTLEICERFGISADAIRAAGATEREGGKVHFVDTLNGTCFGALPYERQTEDVKAFTPWPLVNIPQPRFEAFLSQRLATCTRTSLMRGFTATEIESDEDGVVTTLASGGSGDHVSIRSDYVIAADGASSRSRDGLGIGMVGPEALQHYMMIHFESDLRSITEAIPGLLYFCMRPDASGVFIGYERDRNWVFMHAYDPGAQTRDDFDAATCRALVEAAAGQPLDAFELKNVGAWTMSAQIAEAYRSGRVFLAGDAAHRFPPTGGLGLNTGIGDAQNLTWKLSKVLSGAASPTLLDSYDAERRPIAQINSHQSLTNSAKLMHLFAALYGPDIDCKTEHYASACAHPDTFPAIAESVERQRPHFDSFNLQLGYRYGADVDPDQIDISDYRPCFDIGDCLPHVALADETWLLGRLRPNDFGLVTGPENDAWLDADIAIVSEGADFQASARPFHLQAGIGPDGALLIRPDGHICARWETAPADPQDEINQQIANALGY